MKGKKAGAFALGAFALGAVVFVIEYAMRGAPRFVGINFGEVELLDDEYVANFIG